MYNKEKLKSIFTKAAVAGILTTAAVANSIAYSEAVENTNNQSTSDVSLSQDNNGSSNTEADWTYRFWSYSTN